MTDDGRKIPDPPGAAAGCGRSGIARAAVRRLGLLLGPLLLWPAAAEPQAVRGRVIGDADGRPVAQAHISVLRAVGDEVVAARIGPDGSFLFDLPGEGTYRLRVQALGYATLTTEAIEVAAASLVTVEVRLREDAIALEPLRVVAQRPEPPFMAELRYRNRMGFGRLITREELDDRFGSRLQDVLRDAGVQFLEREDGTGRMVPFALGRLLATASGYCESDLYLNGVRQFTRTDPLSIALMRVDELFQVRPQDIEAVEVFRGAAQVPAEYSGSSAQCGVIAVWLRAGYEDPIVQLPYLGPLPKVTVNVTAARYEWTGAHAPAPGSGVEAAAYWRLWRGASLGARLRRTTHQLSGATTEYLMRGTPAPEPGPRPLTVTAVALEPRLVLFQHAPVRPVIGARAEYAHRRFDVEDRFIHDLRHTHASGGSGLGVMAGLELTIARRVGVEAALSTQRLRFRAYPLLETSSKPTAGEWRARGARVGVTGRL